MRVTGAPADSVPCHAIRRFAALYEMVPLLLLGARIGALSDAGRSLVSVIALPLPNKDIVNVTICPVLALAG